MKVKAITWYSLHTSKVAYQASAYFWLLQYMYEVTGSISTPKGWDANPSQCYPQNLNLLVPFYTTGRKEAL